MKESGNSSLAGAVSSYPDGEFPDRIDPAWLHDVYLEASVESPAARAQLAALNRWARNERLILPEAAPPHPAPVRIVIHIGATKTGSTFLQNLFEMNRPALLRQGIWYPEIGIFQQPGPRGKQAGHARWMPYALEGRPEFRWYLDAALGRLGSRVHTVLLSSEGFFLHPRAPELASYFEGHRVEILCYLRHQEDWANAQYCEFVGGGAVGRTALSMPAWLATPQVRRWMDYAALLAPWVHEVGRRGMRVRIYDRAEFTGGSLLEDVVAATGLTGLRALEMPPGSASNAFPLERAAIEALRPLNALAWPERAAYFRFVSEVSEAFSRLYGLRARPFEKPVLIEPGAALGLRAAFAGSNARLAREFPGRSASLFGPAGPLPRPSPRRDLEPDEICALARALRAHASPEDLDRVRDIAPGPLPAALRDLPPDPREKEEK